MLGWSQDDLAKAAFVGRQTVADFERGARMPIANNLASLKQAFERAGIEFLSEQKDESGAGIRLLRSKDIEKELSYDNPRNYVQNQGYSVSSNDISAGQCKMARVALGWGVRDLAKNASVSPDTIARLERGEQLKSSTLLAVRTTFESAGIEFIPENGGGPGVRAPKRKG
jgi:transcriptional regulator with XRE-family HTH domain